MNAFTVRQHGNIINWLLGKGVQAIAILKITNRSVVYRTNEFKKGCLFVPKAILESAPKTKKPVKKDYYLVVQDIHNALWVTYSNLSLTATQVAQIVKEDGLIFEVSDRQKAIDTAYSLNYPEGYCGLKPKAAAPGARYLIEVKGLAYRVVKQSHPVHTPLAAPKVVAKETQDYVAIVDDPNIMHAAKATILSLTLVQITEITKQGGLIFKVDSSSTTARMSQRKRIEAMVYSMNYPDGYKGTEPKKAGFGERSYIHRRDVSCAIVVASDF